MKLKKFAGATSEIWQIFVRDSTSTTGGGLTGLAFNTASLTAYYHRDTDTAATVITLATMTVGTFTSSGFKEIDATNMPGWYQFCPPNAALAASAKSCAFHLKGAANMAPLPIEVQLTAVNPDDAVRMGMTALPNAVAEAAGGLYTRGSGAGQINQAANGMIDANVVRNAGTAITSAAGVQEVKVASLANNAITALSINADAITDAKVASDVTIAQVTGSVGSVVGAVGSVTGLTASDVGAIKVKTDNLPSDPADASDIASAFSTVNGTLSTIAAYVDTEIGDIQSRLPAALVSGRMDASVGAMASDVVTATAIAADAIGASEIAADAVAEIAAGVWDLALSGHTTSGTTGEALSDAASGGGASAADIADAVWDEALSGHTTAGSAGKALADTDIRGARTVIRGTVDSGASTTSIPTSAFSPAGASVGQFNGRIVVFDNDTATAALRGEATDITASTNAATPTLTVTALNATPASGDTFSVL